MKWTMERLAEVGVAVLDCDHRTPEARSSGYPYIAIPEIQDGRVELDNCRRISRDDLVSWTRRTKPRGGDVLVTRRGRVGDTAPIPDGVDCAIGQNLVLLRADGSRVDARFLRWATRGPLWSMEVEQWLNVGAVFSSLNVKDIAKMRIPVPDLATQTAIADVLGALDDKIAANERVRRAVGELSSVLFASAIRDSRTARLGDCAKLNERTLKPGSGSIRYLDISSVGVGEFAQPIEFAWSEAPGRARRGVQNGDIIWSTVRPERRSHALILDPPDDLVCSTGLITITPTKVGSAFLYEATRTQEFVDFLVAGSTGSAYPATNAAVFLEAPIPLPDATVLGEFEAQMGPAWRRAAVAAEESRRLAATRDALLPELMSGRLKVKGIVEGASE